MANKLMPFVVLLVVVASFTLFPSAAVAQPDCQGSVNGNSFDLRPLAGQVLTTADPNGQKYSYKVCGFVDTPGCRTATDSTPAVCQQDTNQNYHDCGSQSTATFGPADGANFMISFTGGEGGRSASILFRCDPSAVAPAFLFLAQGPSGIAYVLQLTSKYACPKNSSSPSPKPAPPNECCIYALASDPAVTKAHCDTSCAPVLATYKLIRNFTIDGCDKNNCFFAKK